MQQWFAKKGRRLFRCHKCGFVKVPAGVMKTDGGISIYEDDSNIFMQEGNENYYLDDTNIASCRIKLNWIKSYVPAGAKILDAGANYGHFLKAAEGVYDAAGFDISPKAVAWSLKHFKVNNRVASIYDIPQDIENPFDAVTCWDTIEHLADPLMALMQLRNVIKPNGYLFLSTPDISSFIAKLLGKRWYYLDPIQHISLFSRNSLMSTLNMAGFKIVAFRSFGHYYRMRYIFDRLFFLYGNKKPRYVKYIPSKISNFLFNKSIYVRFGDVAGVACQLN
jgi:2-polyprenyl-3-methyl-5-hydroxy-6-metoxy-1,4-benzoquinol methylase